MHLSPHFSRSEFKCPCCDFSTVDYELLNTLEHVRAHFDTLVIVTSGCRCARHNNTIGGSFNSQHTLGRAADIKVPGVPPQDVYDFLDHYAPNKFGLGVYDSWVHVDTRSQKARWDKREH